MRKLIIIAVLCSLLTACGGEEETPEAPETETVLSEADLAAARIDAAAEQLIGNMAANVVSQLTDAIKANRMTAALDLCASASPAIPDSIPQEGFSIRRVSEKYRNPDNRVTLAEKEVLEQFADVLDAPHWIGRWEEHDSVTVYRYYQPIHVLPVCLKCHGNMQTLSPGILSKVKRRYPTDKATGYVAGDLRGMYIVEVNWPQGESLTNWLLGDSLQ